jgi:hypothetical protein
LSGVRTFGVLLSPDGICLVEYRVESTGLRVLDHWVDRARSDSIDQALTRMAQIVSALGVSRARVAIAIEQFGVFHHVMTLPPATDELLRPVISRELQRVFHLTDPEFRFTRGKASDERPEGRPAPQQVLVAGAPRETIDSLGMRLGSKKIDIELATVVPMALRSLFVAAGAPQETIAVLACLEGGLHLAFFIDGRLEFAIDPSIAVEGERALVPMVLDQVERGAVYFRQQFRGATATRMFLAAPSVDYDTLAVALEEQLSIPVEPLFAGARNPAAVIAMGAALEARSEAPLDLYPHPLALADRLRGALRGPNAIVAGLAAAAGIAAIWSTTQVVSLQSLKSERDSLRDAISAGVPAIEPMRKVAESRADLMRRIEFVTATRDERAELGATLQAIAQGTPDGIRFDSLRVVRAANGWSVTITGDATGPTAAQTVRALDAFYQGIRARAGVSTIALDRFDYSGSSTADSSVRTNRPVVAEFHVSFSLAAGAEKKG